MYYYKYKYNHDYHPKLFVASSLVVNHCYSKSFNPMFERIKWLHQTVMEQAVTTMDKHWVINASSKITIPVLSNAIKQVHRRLCVSPSQDDLR